VGILVGDGENGADISRGKKEEHFSSGKKGEIQLGGRWDWILSLFLFLSLPPSLSLILSHAAAFFTRKGKAALGCSGVTPFFNSADVNRSLGGEKGREALCLGGS